MGSLVHQITAYTAARYGINILEQDPAGPIQGVSTSTIAVLAELPWGPVDEVVDIASPAELLEQFAPVVFGNDALNRNAALKAFLGLSFPGPIKVLRPDATSAAKASKTFEDSSAAASVIVEAKYQGAIGNEISVAWSENATDATARDATVTIGSGYSVTYESVAIIDGDLVVRDPGDPYVTFAAASGATAVPVAATATALEGGGDGTATASDYLGSGEDGLERFGAADQAWAVLFVAECPAGLIDAVNAGLKTFANAHEKGMVLLCTPEGQAWSAARTYAGDYRGDRHMYPWPRAKVVNTLDPDRGVVLVQPNADYAVAIASTPPEESPGGAAGAPYLGRIVGLETATPSKAALQALNEAGVAPLFKLSAVGGYIIHRAVTTDLTPGRTKVFRRTMTDFIARSLAESQERYIELPLDLDLAGRDLGPVTGRQISEIRAFLQDLLDNSRIRAFEVDEFSANAQQNIDAGQWRIIVRVKLLSMQEEVIVALSVGEFVEIDEAA